MNNFEKDLLRLNKLKLISYDDMKKSDIRFLEKQGIINGVGPEHYGRLLRQIMTWLFKFLDYKRHDVSFWQQLGFHNANFGLLKYSFVSLAYDYKEICKQGFKMLYLIPKYFIVLIPKVVIILLSYNAVESKKGLKAYNFSK